MARVALICAFAGVAAASGAVELTPDNFDKEVIQSGKSVYASSRSNAFAKAHPSALSSPHALLALRNNVSVALS